MKKSLIILMIVIGIAVLGFVSSYFKSNQENLPKVEEKTKKILKIGEVTLNIEVANTNATRERGLSGRIGLEEDEGMLFVFEKEGNYGFWMKDMNFAIDIAWLDENKKIIYIENDVKPETYPKNFGLNVTSLYVLEMPSGFLVKNNVKIGDQVAF